MSAIMDKEYEARLAALDYLIKALEGPSLDGMAAAKLILEETASGVFAEREDDEDDELWVTPPRDLKV